MAECFADPDLWRGSQTLRFRQAARRQSRHGRAVIPLAPKGEPQYVNIEFPQPFTAQALTVSLDLWDSRL